MMIRKTITNIILLELPCCNREQLLMFQASPTISDLCCLVLGN